MALFAAIKAISINIFLGIKLKDPVGKRIQYISFKQRQ